MTEIQQTEHALDTLGQIAKDNSNNDTIILAIVLIIGLLLVAIPLYVLYSKRDKTKLAQLIQREDRILQVIEGNARSNTSIAESNIKVAEAIANLKTTLDNNDRDCDNCKMEQMNTLGVVMNKQDTTNLILTRLEANIMKRE